MNILKIHLILFDFLVRKIIEKETIGYFWTIVWSKISLEISKTRADAAVLNKNYNVARFFRCKV